jgi:lysozyme family protein
MSEEKTRQATLFPLYTRLLASLQITDAGKKEADRIAEIICKNQDKYLEVSKLTGVPWQFVGALHHMECSGNFNQHLANGDPIAYRTSQEPRGIPAGTWVECAVAALELPGKDYKLSNNIDWKDGLKWLWRAEQYNGFGYVVHHPDVLSPYLWSGTNHYTKGKYVRDGEWGADVVSEQVGVVAIWASLGVLGAAKNITTEAEQMAEIRATLKTTTGTPFKIGKELKARKDLDPHEYIELPEGEELKLANVISENDRSHYKVEAFIDNTQATQTGWIYMHDAGIIYADADPESSPELYAIAKSRLEPLDLNNSKLIQENLARIGLLDPPADGKVGSQTLSAVRAFNRIVHGNDRGDQLTQESLAALPNFTSVKDLIFTAKMADDPEHQIAVKCLNRMTELGAHIAISMGSDKPAYNIFHVTGINPSGTKNSNKINEWNDLRFIVEVSQSGVVSVKLCKLATCEPGQHWIDSPMNSGGTFRIRFDKQYFAWCVGRHGSRQYPALVQSAEIEGYRDSDGDGSWAGESIMSGDYMGINIHHGYNSDKVGIMSAGCQVAKSVKGHEQFMQLVTSDRRYAASNGYLFGNISLDGSKI